MGPAQMSAEIRLGVRRLDAALHLRNYSRASMGPRSIERGNVGTAPRFARRQHASMGPRSIERGNRKPGGEQMSGNWASMGPRSIERGNHGMKANQSVELLQLQWGRAQLSAETQRATPQAASGLPASMGPRSIERGNIRWVERCRTGL